MALLTRQELCKLIDFDSWASVELWLVDVAGPAYREFRRDYMRAYTHRGEPVPPGSGYIKYALVRRYPELGAKVEKREREIEEGVVVREGGVDKSNWETCHHYQHFVVDAVALDRVSARRHPEKNHMTTREWAGDPVKLFAIMYDVTDTVCHN